MTPEDAKEQAQFLIDATCMRKAAARLERYAVQWSADGALSSMDIRKIEVEIATIRNVITPLVTNWIP